MSQESLGAGDDLLAIVVAAMGDPLEFFALARQKSSMSLGGRVADFTVVGSRLMRPR